MRLDRKGMALLAFGILAGCSGAQISLDHYGEGYGQAAPVPDKGGSGPKLVVVAVDGLPDDLTIPTRLPELVQAYRQKLLMMAHPLPERQAQDFADQEIAALRRRTVTEQAFAQALTQRLRPTIARPGSPGTVVQPGAIYPPDDEADPAQERKPS